MALFRRRLFTVTISVLSVSCFLMIPFLTAAVTNYTFGSETVNKGYSTGQANRNAEDTTYQTITEADQYTNTNFSGSSESVTTGTAGGGAFPGSLDTDDATRRSYQEANTAAGSPTYQILRPTSDGSTATLVEYPVSPATDYDKVDETTAGGDADTTYLEGVTNGQDTEMGMADPSNPGGSPNIDVTMWHISRGETTSSCTVVWGIEIGGIEYQGGSTSMTSISYANFSYEWTTNPAGGEWTLSTINGLETYVRVTDANPDTRTTQVALLIEFNPGATYELLATISYSSVTSTSQTTGYMVYCQGYRSGSENFNIQAWDYTGLSWSTKTTVQTASDTDYDFNLASTERDSSGNEVKLRIVDASGGETTQDTVYFDILKVSRIEKGFALDIQMDATGVQQYGDLQLRIKGYTSAEICNVQMYNWGGSSWSSTILTVHELSNTWETYDFAEATYEQSGNVRIRFLDATDSSSDTTADTIYLDVVFVSHYPGNPSLSDDGVEPAIGDTSQIFHFFVTVTDVDNAPPSSGYPKMWIEGSTFAMTENNSGDLDTYDGKLYYYDGGPYSVGVYDFYFITKDAESSEVSSTGKQFEVEAPANNPPELSGFGRSPGDPVYKTTELNFTVTYTDDENEPPSYIRWREDSGATQNLTMYAVDAGDTTYSDGKAFYVTLYLDHGLHDYDYATSDGTTYVNGGFNSVTIQNRDPIIESGPIDQSAWRNVAWSYDFNATDPDSDTIIWGRSGANWLTVDSGGLLSGTTTNTPGVYTITVYANDSYSGQDTHEFDLTILNRPPVITSEGNTTQMLDTYFSYEIEANDPDGDGMGVELSTNCSDLALDGWYPNGTITTPGIYYIHIWVNDSYGGSDLEDWDLIVAENQAPYFTTFGDTDAVNGTAWEWTPTVIDPDDYPGTPFVFSLNTNATWMQINSSTGRVNGTPTAPGVYYYNVTVSDGDKSSSLNTTLTVIGIDPLDWLGVALTLAFGFGTIGIGLFRKEFLLMSGLVWICGGIFYLGQVHLFFMILSLGMGFILLMSAAVEYLETPEKNRHIGR